MHVACEETPKIGDMPKALLPAADEAWSPDVPGAVRGPGRQRTCLFTKRVKLKVGSLMANVST